MSFTRLNYGKDWSNTQDFPTYQSDEAQVRADLQYHPDAVKNYINSVLLPALEAVMAAEYIGARNDNGVADKLQIVLTSHKDKIADLRTDLETLANGGVPSVVMNTPVTFSVGSWTLNGDVYRLVISATDHKRSNANFGYVLYQHLNNDYYSGTWGTTSTSVAYDGGNITLTADEPYAGKIVFFGQ